MRVHRIVEKTYAEGPGCRFCIWVQGCNHKCDGCFATELWNFEDGYDISIDDIILKIESVEKDICGITFLGGEPFEYAEELSIIAKYIHSINKSVVTFTGYCYEQLLNKSVMTSLLNQTDLLIDGKFEKSLVDYSRPLVGSSNQRFIYLTDRISSEEIEHYENRFEIRITSDGTIEFNGMGNIEKLEEFIQSKKESI